MNAPALDTRLADFLAMVNERVPGVSVALSELVSIDQFAALADLSIDVGLVRPPIPEQFESVLVHSEDLVIAVPADHPLASRKAKVVALSWTTVEGISPATIR
ncbi:LysR substrate-binding domain-containing protein, partial [Kibdelosporangium lantanae]